MAFKTQVPLLFFKTIHFVVRDNGASRIFHSHKMSLNGALTQWIHGIPHLYNKRFAIQNTIFLETCFRQGWTLVVGYGMKKWVKRTSNKYLIFEKGG